jgi:hypothetical protein
MRASRDTRGPLDGSAWRALASVVAAGLLCGAAATVMLRSAGEIAAPGDAGAATGGKDASATAAKPAAGPATASKPAPSQAPAPKPAAVPAPRAGAAGPTVAAPATPAPRPKAAAQAAIEQQVTYQYNALGRRDPFDPMVGGDFVGADIGGDAPVDIGGMKVVGIVWGASDKFALVEDARGNSLVLRTGDKVMNGYVEGLRRDAVMVRYTVDGQSVSVAIPLTRKGDSNGNR